MCGLLLSPPPPAPPPLPEQREHLLLRLLAHRAGIHEQQVRLEWVVGGHQIRAGAQHVRHPGGVVLVHLAAEGLDEVAAGPRGCGTKIYLTGALAKARPPRAPARPPAAPDAEKS